VRLLDPSVDPKESKSASISVSRALDEKKAYLVYLIQLTHHSHLTEGVLVGDKLYYISFSCACSVNKVLALSDGVVFLVILMKVRPDKTLPHYVGVGDNKHKPE